MFMSSNYKINPFSRMINVGEDIPSKDKPSSIPNRGPETVAPEEVDLDNHDGKGHTEEYPIYDENDNSIGTLKEEYDGDGNLISETWYGTDGKKKETYDFNNSNGTSTLTQYNENGGVDSHTRYANGQNISTTFYDKDGKPIDYVQSGQGRES